MNIKQKEFVASGNSKSNGFTLIEVLVAVLILSIGLLGIAALQAKSMQFNHSAYLRSQATFLAYDIADRMRANIVAVDAGSYNNGTASAHSNCLTAAATSCTPTVMAGHDLSEWNTALTNTLPSGVGVVCLDTDATTDGASSGSPGCGAGTQYAIKIWWTDDRSGNEKQFVMVLDP